MLEYTIKNRCMVKGKRCGAGNFFVSRNAFSLIELLIVIGVIAVLASLLFPALVQVKEKVKTVSCGNNMRQLALVFSCYQIDFGGYAPPAQVTTGVGKSSKSYYTDILYYGGYIKTCNLFTCPGRKDSESQWRRKLRTGEGDAYDLGNWTWRRADYGYSFKGLGLPKKLSVIKNLSSTIMLVESAGLGSASGHSGAEGTSTVEVAHYYDNDTAWPVHGQSGVCNVLWGDGHMSSAFGSPAGSDLGAIALYNVFLKNEYWGL